MCPGPRLETLLSKLSCKIWPGSFDIEFGCKMWIFSCPMIVTQCISKLCTKTWVQWYHWIVIFWKFFLQYKALTHTKEHYYELQQVSHWKLCTLATLLAVSCGSATGHLDLKLPNRCVRSNPELFGSGDTHG